jgi:hypothetical protein
VVAVLLALTALVVMVPVAIQVVRREYRLNQAWPLLLVAAGMLVVAAAYGVFEGARQGIMAAFGFATALLGMVALQRRT